MRAVGLTAVNTPLILSAGISSKALASTVSLDNISALATGGTKNMTVSEFPATSIFTDTNNCQLSLTPSTTEGPCYFRVDERQDISEGQTGLPMQLCLRVVNDDCEPMSDMAVEVWHCDVEGRYSADSKNSQDNRRFSGRMCSVGDSEAQSARWFRGEQKTDDDGRVNFISCFPGWYRGRTIHIHFRVRNNNRDEVVSQLCFTDAFAKLICTEHPDYVARGEQDTTLGGGRDMVFRRSVNDLLLDTQFNSDGSLLAYKTIVIS